MTNDTGTEQPQRATPATTGTSSPSPVTSNGAMTGSTAFSATAGPLRVLEGRDTDNNTIDSSGADVASGASENEARPLLATHFTNLYASTDENGPETRDLDPSENDSYTDRSYDSYTDDVDDIQSKYSESISDKIVKFSKKRFWWFCGLGVVAVIILNLSFLPRTSLSRDYRRWHNLHLTKSDVKRNFMVYSGERSFGQHNNSQHIDWLLQNFTALNSKNPVNLLAEDNVPLTRFVEHKFQKFGFRTSVHSYEVDLPKPLDAKLVLYDKKNGHKVYNANLLEPKFSTPSYYGFGATASFKGNYVFANRGLQKDFELLAANGVSVKGQTVIIKSCVKSEISIGEKVAIAEQYGAAGLVHYTEFTDKTTPNKKIDSGLATAVKRDTAVKTFFGTNNFQKAKIPVLPVSYKAIEPILNTFSGSKKLKGWDFAPKSTDFDLEIVTSFEDKKRRLTNIVGHIDGIIKDGDIIIGASRDSFDSSNPLSGHVVLLEIMRHFHNLVALGWKPLRNIKFVSFDGARNGQLGPQKFLEDETIKKYVLAYINIDDDAVRGSEFTVDANPMLNHIIRKVSKVVPLPKDTKAFKSLPKLQDDDDNDDEDDDEDEKSVSLYKYWKKQNNATIGNDLGRSVYKTNGFPFQYHATVPIMNVKFANDPKRDSSVYVSNSNYYSYDWLVKREIDDGFVLHSVLIRYLGMLIITLSEHEVVDFKTHFYFEHIQNRVSQFLDDNQEELEVWADTDITKYLDLPFFNFNGDEDEIETFHNLSTKFADVCRSLKASSTIFDSYNVKVQLGLIQDYPWYQLYKKVKLWAQFKVSNYKLLHLDRDLSRKDDDTGTVTNWFNHVFYNNPLHGESVLGDLQAAVDAGNLEKTVKTMFELYEKFKGVDKKMS